MFYSTSILLTHNLHDAFSENARAHRCAGSQRGVYRGRDAVDRVAATIKATRLPFKKENRVL